MWTMNGAGMNSKNIVNSVNMFSDSVAMNSCFVNDNRMNSDSCD